MIKEFLAKNVRNFNKVEINFSIKKSKRVGEFTNNNDFFEINNDKILKVISVTGANASGKTTFLELFNIYSLWTYPHIILQSSEEIITQNFITRDFKLFQQNNSLNYNEIPKLASNWFNSGEYIESLYNHFKMSFEQIFDINCFISNKPIEYNVIYINKDFEEIKHTIIINRNGIVIFKLFNIKNNKYIINEEINYFQKAKLLEIKTNQIGQVFHNHIQTLFFCISSLFEENPISIESFLMSNYNQHRNEVIVKIHDFLNISSENKNKFIEWMQMADESIKDIILDNQHKNISFFIKNNNEKVVWSRLSKGTIKWIYFFYLLYISNFAFDKKQKSYDKIIFIDEIENYLHLKLVKVFLELITSNKDNIQIIFTTHSFNLFDSTFRHQGIFLIENNYLDKNKSSHNLVCLSKYDLKKDRSISKLFLDERIGSYPNGSLIVEWLKKYAK